MSENILNVCMQATDNNFVGSCLLEHCFKYMTYGKPRSCKHFKSAFSVSLVINKESGWRSVIPLKEWEKLQTYFWMLKSSERLEGKCAFHTPDRVMRATHTHTIWEWRSLMLSDCHFLTVGNDPSNNNRTHMRSQSYFCSCSYFFFVLSILPYPIWLSLI